MTQMEFMHPSVKFTFLFAYVLDSFVMLSGTDRKHTDKRSHILILLGFKAEERKGIESQTFYCPGL